MSSYEVEFAVMAAADPSFLVPDTRVGGGVWVRREDLESEALSSLARKLVRHAMDTARPRAAARLRRR